MASLIFEVALETDAKEIATTRKLLAEEEAKLPTGAPKIQSRR